MAIVEPSQQLIPHGAVFKSPGGRFSYQVLGPCCRLYDRAELPWPSCRLSWKGKQPSWRRIGPRFVPDLAASRCPSYSVIGWDAWGTRWEDVVTIYHEQLAPELRQWWHTRKPHAKEAPPLRAEFLAA